MKIFLNLSIVYHVVRFLIVCIIGQTLYFKFTGSEESRYIFTILAMEPWGRIGLAILETVCILLIIIPKYVWLGALLAFNLMLGAILSHFVFLGIVVQDDGGLLFGLAVLVFFLSIYLLYIERKKIPYIKDSFPID
ncbi:DoxX family protein [Leptospira bouyouniensis]|uniref:DoxX family protein n=1 Tax=Leptospira bouyouniensis TaxID=2484911 RepID=A0A7I0HN50_9LEPT|nr:DoxX family protein [Leptospira bouyouniensis]TGK48699.1 DoxX family protein [Leptospira bouyouniensis]TGL02212.1 DoxX family protein [Leptospira bouyouniensis]